MLKYPSVVGKKPRESQKLVLGKETNEEAKSGFFQNYFGSQIVKEKRITIGFGDLLLINNSWEISLFSVITYDDLIVKWGGYTVNMAYLFLCIIVTIPLQMMLLFLGRYTRQGYFRFWDICPIFRGMMFAVTVFSIAFELLNIGYSGLAIIFALKILKPTLPWTSCNFKGVSQRCRPMYPSTKYTKNCCSYGPKGNCTELMQYVNVVLYSTLDYFRIVILGTASSSNHESGIGEIVAPWIYAIAFNWFIIFICLTFGFKRFRLVISKITAFAAIMLLIPTMIGIIYIGGQYPIPVVPGGSWRNTLSLQFWYRIFVQVLAHLVPGNFVYIGSLAPDSLKPTTIVFLTFCIKYLLHLLFATWRSLGLHLIADHYKIEDIQCIYSSGLVTLFAVIPDLLARIPIPQLPLLLWFFGLWYFGLVTALYTMTAFLESLIELVPGVKSVRVFCCAVVTCTCFMLNLIFTTRIHIAALNTFTEIFVPYGSFLLFFILFISMVAYSLRRLEGDYFFTYGEPLSSYWIHTLKYSGFYIFAVMLLRHISILNGTNTYSYLGQNNVTFHTIFYGLNTIMTIPIILLLVMTYLSAKNAGDAKRAITPTERWGPPTDELKHLRMHFNPHREFRYTTGNQSCNHTCLLYSEKLDYFKKTHKKDI